MASFTSIVLVALCALQYTVARPRLQDSDPMVQARVIVSEAQEFIMTRTKYVFSPMDDVRDDIFETYEMRVQGIASLEDFAEYYEVDTPEKVKARAAYLRELYSDAEYYVKKWSSGTTRASSKVHQILLAAAAKIDEIGEKVQPAKALLSTIEDAYAEFFKSATVTFTNAAQTGVKLVNEGLETFETNPDDHHRFNDIETQIVHLGRAHEGLCEEELKRVDAAVQSAIAAFFRT